MPSADERDSFNGPKESIVGNINVGLLFKPDHDCFKMDGIGTLRVTIKQVVDLSTSGFDELSNYSVHSHLFPNIYATRKRKTLLILSDMCPNLEEMTYNNVKFHDLLEKNILEISVEQGMKLFGGVRLGSYPGRSSELKLWRYFMGWESVHWENMLCHPGVCIEGWHRLQLPMAVDNLAISLDPPPFKKPLFQLDAEKSAYADKQLKVFILLIYVPDVFHLINICNYF